MTTTDLADLAVALGAEAVREARGADDAIDGAVPRVVAEPSTPEAVAAALAWANTHRCSTVIRGSGSKLPWGRPPSPIDLVLSTRGLARVLAHEHGDMTATVEAGATLAEVNHTLARHRQWLPLDPPFADRATIGGLVATNDSGPARHRHGTPRDLVLGVRVALPDGTLAKAGGRVVKNVAGYDLSKFFCGSFGSLCAIVSATFKLAPTTAASATVEIRTSDGETPTLVAALLESQLEPESWEIEAALRPDGQDELHVLVRFVAAPAAVEAAVAALGQILGPRGDARARLDGADEERRWRDHDRFAWEHASMVLRASWLPRDVARVISTLREVISTGGTNALRWSGRLGVGAGLISLDADLAAQATTIARLRQSPAFGNVVVLRGSPALKADVDVWGAATDHDRVLTSIKRALDPNGILNAGRGVV